MHKAKWQVSNDDDDGDNVAVTSAIKLFQQNMEELALKQMNKHEQQRNKNE